MTHWDRYPHFERHEFVCPCGCGRADMDDSFMAQLELIRGRFDLPMSISSGFRCPEHNDAVSTTGKDGPHTTGKAADISISGVKAKTLLNIAPPLVSGFGIKQHGPHEKRFFHLDTLRDDETEGPRPWVWSYP